MSQYDPIHDLCEHVRALVQIWADWSMDFHPAYEQAKAAVERAERWAEEHRLVEAEAR